jgi:hypothetical protein
MLVISSIVILSGGEAGARDRTSASSIDAVDRSRPTVRSVANPIDGKAGSQPS